MSKRPVKKNETTPMVKKMIDKSENPIWRPTVQKKVVVKKAVTPKKPLIVQTSVHTVPKPSSGVLNLKTDKVITRWEKLISESYTISCSRTAQKTYLGQYSMSTSTKHLPISKVKHVNEKVNTIEITKHKKSIGDTNVRSKPLDNMRKLRMELKDETESRKLLEKYLLVSEEKENESRLALAANVDEIESLKLKYENLQNANNLLNERYEETAKELENHKTNNHNLNDLYNYVIERCKYLEENGDVENVRFYKKRLEEITEEHENAVTQNSSLQYELDQTNSTLDSLQKRIEIVMEESARKVTDLGEKLCQLEEEVAESKHYQTFLEEQYENLQKAMSRKDQYIKQQEFKVEELSKDKRTLEKTIGTMTLSEPSRSVEMENYQRQIKNLTASIEQMKNAFTLTEAAYNKEMEDIRKELKNRDRLIATKNEVIRHQEKALRLVKEINGTTENTPSVNYNSFTEENSKWRKIYDDIELETAAFSDPSAVY